MAVAQHMSMWLACHNLWKHVFGHFDKEQLVSVFQNDVKHHILLVIRHEIWYQVKLDEANEWRGKSNQFLGKKDLCHHTTRLQCEGLKQGWNTTEFHVVGVLEVTLPPPINNYNLRIDFCMGHFYLIGGDNQFSKVLILFTAFFSRMAKTAMKYSDTMSISRSNSCTLCAEWGVCTGLGEHMDPGGGRLGVAVHKTRYTWLHTLHLLQIIISVASGPGWHAWQGVAVITITFDICGDARWLQEQAWRKTS